MAYAGLRRVPPRWESGSRGPLYAESLVGGRGLDQPWVRSVGRWRDLLHYFDDRLGKAAELSRCTDGML
jgi:hypothetical protein